MSDQGGMKRELEEEGGVGPAGDDGQNKRMRSDNQQRVELRLLLASKNAGAIIGKGGSNIKRLRSDFNASVTVPDSDGPERILTVGAPQKTACDVLLDVIPTLEDYQQYKNRDDYDCEVRMLVHQSQAGCIIGRGGNQIKKLREETGAQIKVYSQCCPHSSERTVQISGTPNIVVNCVDAIFTLIETAPPKGSNNPYDPHNFDEFVSVEYGGYTSDDNRRSGRGGRGGGRGGGMDRGSRGGRSDFGMGRGGFSRGGRSDFGGRGRGGRGGRGGFGGFGGDRYGDGDRYGGRGGDGYSGGYGSGGRYGGRDEGGAGGFQDDGAGGMFGESTTTQVSIPKDLAGAIIGKGGSRIRQIREQSGAGITIDEPLAGSSDRIITITGTTDQIQHSQYLLQASVKMYSGKKF